MIKPLKKTIGLLGVAALISCGTTPTSTILTGSVPEYKGEGYLLIRKTASHGDYDTIVVQPDGTFKYEVKDLAQNEEYMLLLEYLGKNKETVECYLMPNTSLDVQITGKYTQEVLLEDTMQVYQLTPRFTGKAVKECDYLNLPLFWDYVYKNEDGTPVSFKNYQGQMEANRAFKAKALEGTNEEFAREKMQMVEEMLEGREFVFYRWLVSNGDDPMRDADFMAFVNSINLNDVKQAHYAIDYISIKLAANKEYHKGESITLRYFYYIRDYITNKEAAELVADGIMGSMITGMDPNDLKPVFAVYKQLSGKSEMYKENERIYQNLSKLLPGTKAIDFNLQDTEGNVLRFSDVIGKGKITYIDFWATWCGPCCAQIPHMEKLAAYYKDNEKIELISISLDDNREKWLKKLKEDKPEWAQYLIPEAFESTFSKEYCVNSIPQFMLFDAEGRIIELNAPFPSHKGVKEYLEKYMK